MIKVLDHGFARLVSYMQPVPQDIDETAGWNDTRTRHAQPEGWSGDLEIVRNARVSYDADWRTGDDDGKDARLINRMMEGKHSSPFEAMVFTFEIKAPIFVFRQWHRHRTWSYNEVSARYTEIPDDFYVPKPEHIGVQSKTDKQMRDLLSAAENITGFIPTVAHDACSLIKHNCEQSFKSYKAMLNAGVPRELARGILPLNTYSRMFATVDLHNLFHFLRLRLDSHAQYEIRVYAEALLELVTPICPVAVGAFQKTLRES